MVIVNAAAQYSIPPHLFDSMAFEVSKGRQCNKLVLSMEAEIQRGIDVEIKLLDELSKTEQQLNATQDALKLINAENAEIMSLYNTQLKLTKQAEGQARRWKIGAGFAIFVIFGQLFFGG